MMVVFCFCLLSMILFKMMGTQDKQQLDVVTSHDRPVEKNYINSTLINRSFSPQVLTGILY